MLRKDDPPYEIRERLWQGALEARMNVIYHQRQLKLFSRLEFWSQAITWFIASGGVALAVVFVDNDYVTVGVGVLAALIGIVSRLAGFSAKTREYSRVLPAYVMHVNRLEDLFLASERREEEALQALRALAATEQEESSNIGSPDETALQSAYDSVLKEIGAAPSKAA